ncbi:MAG: hypothetical protein CL624_09205 [Arcobacter sp.]|nr:hypothetical protein [Arcobacter sp.]|tara:strand:- start:1533 stop:3848 length:2316 start_codon:yes stop_codon:yes gene_type:complete
MEIDTKKIFQLRKEKNLTDAYSLALDAYNQEPNDEWVQKAYAWVLIDIVKAEIINNINQARNFFSQLLSIDFIIEDEIITKQINYLRPKLDVNSQQISEAESLSKNGNHQQSLTIIHQLKQNGQLSLNTHESYGWILYRYLKDSMLNLHINDVKKLFFEYINLKNERPSILHSSILRLALMYSQKASSFELFKFFQIWNPELLTNEDKSEQYSNDKTYPSLVSRVLKEFVYKKTTIDINYLQLKIGNNINIIDIIREQFFWQIFYFHKENRIQELWSTFEFYVINYSNFGSSHWHSEILDIAERFMKENDSFRFFPFIQKWNVDNFRAKDWIDVTNKDGYTKKALVIRVLKKVTESIKQLNETPNNINMFIELFKKSIEKTNDIWLKRDFAILKNKLGKNTEAINIYKQITLELGDQAYIWHEFSKLINHNDMKLSISMLCKASMLQKNEDFLGEIHLDLAKQFTKYDLLEETRIELELYKKHREEKGWKLSDDFVLLYEKVKEVNISRDNNKEFYKENTNLAENYLYEDIPFTTLLIYDVIKTKEEKGRVLLSDLNDINLMVNKYKFSDIKHSKVNDIVNIKLHYDKENDKYLPLQTEKVNINYDDFISQAPSNIAIVDHINNSKNLFHYIINKSSDGILKFSQTELRPSVGDFIKIKYFKTYDKKQSKYRTHILNIENTNETNSSLFKRIEGMACLKYKGYERTYDFDYITSGKIADELGVDITKPDFAFIDDYYIPKYLLQKHNIVEDTYLTVDILYNGEKWQVFKIK